MVLRVGCYRKQNSPRERRGCDGHLLNMKDPLEIIIKRSVRLNINEILKVTFKQDLG